MGQNAIRAEEEEENFSQDLSSFQVSFTYILFDVV